jgi:soluble lytic murein transglycosylase
MFIYKNLEIDGSENHEDINHIEKAKELLQLELYTSASLEIEAGSTELEEDSVKILDPLFTLAVIREESRFQPEVGSFAGALGLMQIIPSTGQGIANQIGIFDFDSSMLLDPETSIKMGTFYLRQQLNSFSENKFYTCGAYNGGPGAMSKWIADRGNKDIDTNL